MHPYLSHLDYLTQSRMNTLVARINREESGGLFRRWLSAISRQWRRRSMIAALESLDDRLLRDIGLHRSDIPRVVDGLDDRELRMAPVARAAKPAAAYDLVYRQAA